MPVKTVCPSCQIAVYSQYTRPGVWFVRGGTLDDPSGVAPDVHIFTRSKLSWVSIPDGVPTYDVFYDMRALWPAASLQRVEAMKESHPGPSRAKTTS